MWGGGAKWHGNGGAVLDGMNYIHTYVHTYVFQVQLVCVQKVMCTPSAAGVCVEGYVIICNCWVTVIIINSVDEYLVSSHVDALAPFNLGQLMRVPVSNGSVCELP